MTTKYPLLVLILLSLGACTNRAEKELVGNWQGIEFLEERDSLEMDPAELRFTFLEDKLYTFSGTLNYQEAGTFRVQPGYLFTTDTTHVGSKEKAVRIVQLEADTLVFEMKEQNKTRTIKLLRSAQ